MRIFSRNPEPKTPRSSEAPQAQGVGQATSDAALRSSRVNVPTRVNALVVEDSATQALVLQNLLEERGYVVETARNGKEALDYLNELRGDQSRGTSFRPTLILSDIMMPEMDGNEFCRHLKADQEFKDIPVILLTSITDPKEALLGLYNGADYLIAKPYETSFLMARIDDVLATLHRGIDNPDQMFTFTMDGQKYQISNERLRVINSVFTVYETVIHQNRKLEEAQRTIQHLRAQLDESQRLLKARSVQEEK